MIEINKLYGVLLGTSVVPAVYEWYKKKFTVCKTNDKINNILAILCLTVPETRRAVFACLICNAVLHTIFGKEIENLDPVNTYVPVKRPTDDNDDQDFCLFQMIGNSQSYQALKQYLDDDIKEKLVAPTFVDYIAAGCLQILRELAK
jgi:hypothetical protein